MPTNYTGDELAVALSPDPGPQAGARPVFELFGDGEAANAASVAQFTRTIANHLARLYHPQAHDNQTPNLPFKNRRGLTRYGVDHLALPAGQYITHDVIWKPSPIANHSSRNAAAESFFPVMPEWRFKALDTVGTQTYATMAHGEWGPYLAIIPSLGPSDYVTVSGQFGLRLRNDNHVVMSFSAARGEDAAANRRSLFVGLVDPTGFTTHVNAQGNYVAFRADSGTDVWTCVTRAGGVEETTVTAVEVPRFTPPYNQKPTRLRIEWCGRNAEQDSVRKVRFWAGGSLVATHLLNLPLISAVPAISDVRINAGAASGDDVSVIGPMRLQMTLEPEDAFL